jgi:hypothetical protein
MDFFHGLPDEKSKARFRGVVSNIASTPLRTLPNTVASTYTSSDFQWVLCNRIQAPQPAAHDIQLQYCSCIHGIQVAHPIGDGRHFRRCRKHNVMARIHDTIRDLLHMMARAAGLTSVREPRGLLPDCEDERPADWFITGWSVPGVEESKHALDLTCPLADSGWDNLILAVKTERAMVVGSAGVNSEYKKSAKVGSQAEQRARGNAESMEARCKQQQIHFWPVALEGDGVATESFMSYFNAVCDAAQRLKGANRSTFKAYFLSRLANTLHQVSARLALRQTAACRARLVGLSQPDVALQEDVDFSQELQTTVPAYVSKRREWRARNSNLGVRLHV